MRNTSIIVLLVLLAIPATSCKKRESNVNARMQIVEVSCNRNTCVYILRDTWTDTDYVTTGDGGIVELKPAERRIGR